MVSAKMVSNTGEGLQETSQKLRVG